MRSLRQIKNRIRSIENTKKVTSALQLVSVAKFSKLEKFLYASRPYLQRLQSVLSRISAIADVGNDPLFIRRPLERSAVLCVVSADGGLCGTYNNNLLRAAEKYIVEKGADKLKIIAVGKKAAVYFRNRSYNVIASFTELTVPKLDGMVKSMRETMVKMYLSREIDAAYILYTKFETALVQKVTMEHFLPLSIAQESAEDSIYEPDAQTIAQVLMPRYCTMKLRLMLLEALTSEYAARTVAMKMATDNARDLLQGLILKRNKVRQARITQDIMEIISSAEALKA